MILPETAGQKLLVDHGRVVGVRTGDKGRGKDGRAARELRAGRRRHRADHRPRRGNRGPPDHRGDRPFRPRRAEPADLGARRQGGLEGPEAAAADRPHDGLAAAQAGALRRVRRLVDLPDGRGARLDRLRRRARVRGRRALRARPAPGVQDAPARPQDPRRAASASPGARRRSPRAACTRCRRSSTRPGLLLVGEGAGLVNVPRLKGVHYAIESGRLAAEAAFAALQRGEVAGRRGALDALRRRAPRELRLEGARPRSGTCGRPSTRASSWAARSRAR